MSALEAALADNETAELRREGRLKKAAYYRKHARDRRNNGKKYLPKTVSKQRGTILSRHVLEGRPIQGTDIHIPKFILELAVKRGLPGQKAIDLYVDLLRKLDEAAAELLHPTKLSETDLAAFKAHTLAAPWVPGKRSPSVFIREEFAQWLSRGLRRIDLTEIVPKLAAAYATELKRHRERRVADLIEAPKQLPAGTPLKSLKRIGARRLAAELSPEALDRQQARKRVNGQAYRKRQKDRIRTDPLTP